MKVVVNGTVVETEPGRTVAAVAETGLFCGIGVCFGCLVTVNGEREVRACQRILAEGDDVRTAQ